MQPAFNLRMLAGAALAFALLNQVGLNIQAGLSGQHWLGGDRVEAKSSGGRSRGGSFSRPSNRSGGSVPRNNPPNSAPQQPGGYYPAPGPVIVPGGGYYGGGYGIPLGGIGVVFLLAVLGFMVMPIIMAYIKSGARGSQGGYGSGYSNSELDNDTVTVTRLQVALLAQARYIQTALADTVTQYDSDTPEGRTQQLQETVLALLRSPENWSHARADSQTVRSREEATRLFEQLSIEERSKFSAETLVRVGGKVRRQAMPQQEDEGPAYYIVVTLLLGTANDRPLIDSIHSTEELHTALQRIGAITPEYLLVFELLWSPEDASDSLSRDELVAEYPNLVQIA